MKLLQLLKNNNKISGQMIAEKLGISRAAIHKQIQTLRKKGFKIKGVKNTGYTLEYSPDLINPEEIKSASAVIYKQECASTQSIAKNIADKAEDFTLVISETQSSGYGRIKRAWESPKGGIWFSLILKPKIMPEIAPQLTLVMCLSICIALEKFLEIKPSIKWPNDILFAGKKLSGILTEMSAEVGRTNWVIIGVGLNVNNHLPKNIKNTAVSLNTILKTDIDRNSLISSILETFKINYNIFIKKGFKAVHKQYCERSSVLGRPIKVNNGETEISGKAFKIDENGYIYLLTKNNSIEKIMSGDIL